MAVPENVLTDIKRIVFSNHEPWPPYKVMWAKKNEENTFNYYVFNDGEWNDVSSYVIPEVSAYLSAFINDVGFITEEAIQGKQDVIVDLDEIRSGAAAGATAYQKPQSGIPKSDLASGVQDSLNAADSAYQKPNTGIPKTDLASGVQQSLDKADAAVSAVQVNGDALRITKGGVNTDLTVPYAERAGEAKNLEGTLMKDSTFLYRPTANHTDVASGDAQIEGIKGNTVKFNQAFSAYNVVNTFAIQAGLTATKDGRMFNASGTVQGEGYIDIKPASSLIFKRDGRKYCVLANQTIPYGWGITGYATAQLNIGTKGFIWSANSVTDWRTTISVYIPAGTEVSINNLTFSIIDLTAIFGAGNEPATVADFEAWLATNVGLKDYYDYTAGELVPVKMTGIKTVGFNQLKLTGRTEYATPATPNAKWDFLSEDIVIKGMSANAYINPVNIASYSISESSIVVKTSTSGASNAYGTGFPIRVLPNTSYYIGCIQTSGATIGISWFDKEGYFISYGNTINSSATSPANAYWCIITFKPGAVNTEATFTNPIVNLSHSGNRNGEYEPYWTETKQIPVTTMTGKLNGQGSSVVVFPDGLKKAGSVRDEIVGNKANKRVGVVDMGSLTWSYATNTEIFSASVAGKQFSNPRNSGLVCSIYPLSSTTVLSLGGLDNKSIVGRENSTAIYVRDDSYTDATTFTAAMQGVKLYYELATPEEYILDDFELPKYYKVDDYGTEEILPENSSELTTCAPTLDIKYGLNATDSMRNIYDNFVCASESQEFSDGKKAMARQNIGAIGQADIAGKEDKVEIVSVESGTAAITAAVGKYYSVAGSVGTLAITLPAVSDTSHLQSIVISLTAGATPNVSFASADSAAISYFRGYEILANTSYEINCLFNGTKWIIGYAIVD